MSKPIEIRLSDAQCAALAAEAEAAGLRFFDHCRAKLLAGMSLLVDLPLIDAKGRQQPQRSRTPLPPMQPPFARGEVSPLLRSETSAVRDRNVVIEAAPESDRIDRLEALVMRMAETFSNVAQQQEREHSFAQEPPESAVDIDDIVAQSLGEAERQGLTVVERDVAPAATGGVRHVGTRPPTPFSPTTQPRHLQGLGG